MQNQKSKMRFKELLRHNDFRWFNRFMGDIFLILVVAGLQYLTRFNSKVIFLITGMLIVWIAWQFTDFINSKRKLS